MIFSEYYMARVWYPVFEGDEGGSPEGAGEGADGSSTGSQDPGSADPPPANDGKVSFNADQQKELNRILAAEKKKHQKLVQQATDEAKAMGAKARLTAQQSQELDARLDQIQNEMRTKEEQAKRAADKARKQYQDDMKKLSAEKEDWQRRYTESTIERSLTDAAASSNAFSPRQIVAILGPNTELAQVLDSEGQPTGQLAPKVKYRTKDKEGKSVTLDLSPIDAVKRMKDEEEYLNLFRGEGSGGAGLRSQPGGKKPNLRELAKDPAAYRKARAAGQIPFQK